MSRLTRMTAVTVMAAGGLCVVGATGAFAQITVTLPDTSQTTMMTAAVTEQARVAVPSGVTFTVSNVGSATASSGASITVDQIVLATATKQLQISLQASALSFTPPAAGATTWSAGDVTWNAASWTNATGAAGTLSHTTYTPVATCDANAPACSTTGLVFTLAAKPAVQRSGNHTLVVTWKFESIGS